MKKTYSLRALILLSCLVFSLSMTCAFPQSSKSEAGNGTATNIQLNARIKPSFNVDRPEIECEIINTTPSPVDYDAWLDSLGFDFRLRDAQGAEVTMNERWFTFNSPRYTEWTKTRTLKIAPGDKIAYTLRLDEAFGPTWKRGVKLEVGWFQKGSDDTEPTMSTEVLLPLAKMAASEKAEEPNATEKAGAKPAAQLQFTTKPPPTPEAKPTVPTAPPTRGMTTAPSARHWLEWFIPAFAAWAVLMIWKLRHKA